MHRKAAGDDQGHRGICRDSRRYALLLKAAENAIYKWRWISEKEESKELHMRFTKNSPVDNVPIRTVFLWTRDSALPNSRAV